MNTALKVGAAGALALGAIGAHANIASPSSGAADAILFAEVLNSSGSAVASYAGDTGVSINSLVAGLSGTTTVLGSDANLAKLFAADGAGDTLYWAVQGGQWTGTATAANFGTAGNAKFITTTLSGDVSSLGLTTTNFVHWSALATDVGSINSEPGVTTSVEGSSPSSSGIWDQNNPNGTSGWYANGPVTGNTLGTTDNLYYVTGGGTKTSSPVSSSQINSETASLSANGLTLTGSSGGGSPPPVPLPAAVWLFGSGLLGLTGIARRKSKV